MSCRILKRWREEVTEKLGEGNVLAGVEKEPDGRLEKGLEREDVRKGMKGGLVEGGEGEGLEELAEVEKTKTISKKKKLIMQKKEKTERYEEAKERLERGEFKSLRSGSNYFYLKSLLLLLLFKP